MSKIWNWMVLGSLNWYSSNAILGCFQMWENTKAKNKTCPLPLCGETNSWDNIICVSIISDLLSFMIEERCSSMFSSYYYAHFIWSKRLLITYILAPVDRLLFPLCYCDTFSRHSYDTFHHNGSVSNKTSRCPTKYESWLKAGKCWLPLGWTSRPSD